MNKIYLGVIIVTLGMISGILTAHTVFGQGSGTPGWYTLNARHECNPGETRDGGCFCNNPNPCTVTFTNDPKTNELILLDVIKSQGSGHFIPGNLQALFDDINTSISQGNTNTAFAHCTSINNIRGLNINCQPLNTQSVVQQPQPQPQVQQNQQFRNNEPEQGLVNQPKYQQPNIITVVPGNTSQPVLPLQPSQPQIQQPQQNGNNNDGNNGGHY